MENLFLQLESNEKFQIFVASLIFLFGILAVCSFLIIVGLTIKWFIRGKVEIPSRLRGICRLLGLEKATEESKIYSKKELRFFIAFACLVMIPVILLLLLILIGFIKTELCWLEKTEGEKPQ